MNNKKLRKGILSAVLIITIINIISMYSWFSFKIEPIIDMTITIKEKISEKELNDQYKETGGIYPLNNIQTICMWHDNIRQKYVGTGWFY